MVFTKFVKSGYRKRPMRNRRLRRPRRGLKNSKGSKSGLVTTSKRIVYPGFHQSPFPVEYITKFRTKIMLIAGDTVGSPFTSGGLWHTDVIANGCLAPLLDIATATGVTLPTGYSGSTNPVGLQELCNANMYQRYQVLASKLIVRANPQDATDQVMVTVTPSTDSGVPTNAASAGAEPWTKMKIFKSSDNRNDKALVSYVPMAKFFGIQRVVFDNDTSGIYNSFFTANPSSLVYYTINVQTLDGSLPTDPLPIELELVQYVRCYGMVNAGLS